jgi:acyl-CoA dehydrogenase
VGKGRDISRRAISKSRRRRCVGHGPGKPPIADLALLKVEATETLQFCADTALHLKAGEAYNSTSRLQLISQQARTFAIAGGAAEILKDLATRQLKI